MEIINLDLTPGRVPPVCHASQFDIGRVIRINLLDGKTPHTLTGTEEIYLRTRKPNGEEVVEEVENTADFYVDIVTSKDTCDVAGENWCELRIDTIGTHNFKMAVEHDAYDGNLSTGSASGLIASFTTDLAEDLAKCEVDIEYTQDTHGYDSTWPAGRGTNQWNEQWELGAYNSTGTKSDSNVNIRCVDYVPVIGGEDYCFVCEYAYVAQICWYTEDKTFISPRISNTTSGPIVLTAPSNAKYCRFSMPQVYGTNYRNDIAVQYPATVDEYSPYENYCPFEYVDKVKIIDNKGNLGNFINGKGISSSGSIQDTSNRIATVDPIYINPNQRYFVKRIGEQSCSFIFCVYKNGEMIRREIGHVDGDEIDISGGDCFRVCGYGNDITVRVEETLPMIVTDANIEMYIPFEQTESEIIISDGSQVNTPFNYSGTQYSIDLVLGEDNSLNWNGTNSSSSNNFIKPTSTEIDDTNAFFNLKPGTYELRVDPYVGDDAQVELMVNAARGSAGESLVATTATRNVCAKGYENCFIRFRVPKQKMVDVDDGEYGVYSIGAAKGKIDLVNKKVYVTQILYRVLPGVSNLTYTSAGAYRFSTPAIYRNDGQVTRTGMIECGAYEIRGAQSTTYIRHINGIDDLDTFKEFIIANPIHVPYNLAEPIVMDISMLNITTFVGKNNIMSTNGRVDVEYYKTNNL